MSRYGAGSRFTVPQNKTGAARDKAMRPVLLLVNLLLLTVAILGAYFLHTLFAPDASKPVGESKMVLYVLEFSDKDGDFIPKNAAGKAVTDAKTGTHLGTVVRVEKGDASASRPVIDGAADTAPATVLVTVSLSATYFEDKGYCAGDIRMVMGNAYTVSILGAVATGVCLRLQ